MGYIAILNYGLGNLRSVQNAFSSLGIDTIITKDRDVIMSAKGLVIPGVGAFPLAMENLKNENLIEIIDQFKNSGKLILGICLGMQILFSKGFEYEETSGLCWISGNVLRIGTGIRLPHISWSKIIRSNDKHWLFDNLTDDELRFYFVHSYSAQLLEPENVVAITYYENLPIVSIVQKDNVIGMQFHPEKSGKAGLTLLRNFCIKCGL